MISALAQRNPFGDNKTCNQTNYRAGSSISIALSGKLHPVTPEHRTRYQQQQWQQIYQTDSAQYRTLGNRYDDFISDTGIDWIFYLELARFAAKQLGQLARPATLATALLTTIGLTGLNKCILTFNLNNYGARLQHDYLPL
jgi:hypothetical protein